MSWSGYVATQVQCRYLAPPSTDEELSANFSLEGPQTEPNYSLARTWEGWSYLVPTMGDEKV